MPRPPKITTELRMVRDALSEIEERKIPQREFAERLQVSEAHVKAIEAGQTPMTAPLAFTVFSTFGAWLSPLPEHLAPANVERPLPKTPFVPWAGDPSDLKEGIRSYLALTKGNRADNGQLTVLRLLALIDAASAENRSSLALEGVDKAIARAVANLDLSVRFVEHALRRAHVLDEKAKFGPRELDVLFGPVDVANVDVPFIARLVSKSRAAAGKKVGVAAPKSRRSKQTRH